MTLRGFTITPSDTADVLASGTLFRVLVVGGGNVRLSLRDDAGDHVGVVLGGLGVGMLMLPFLVRRVWALDTTAPKLVGVVAGVAELRGQGGAIVESFDVDDRVAPLASNLSIAATRSFAITPNDGTDLALAARWLHVGVGGGETLSIVQGGATVPVVGVRSGTLLDFTAPGRVVTRVRATGTTTGLALPLAPSPDGDDVGDEPDPRSTNALLGFA